MARYVYRPQHPNRDENGMVDVLIAGPKYESGNATNVISDHMDPLRHMANGLMYDSKAAFRKATKDAGCCEVGNEVSTLLKPRPRVELSRNDRRDAIRKAIAQLR